jgi:hypothetical protein
VTPQKGFFKSLYDFKFSSLITSRVIRFVYTVIVILDTITAVITFFELIRQGSGFVPIAIIGVPIVYILGLIFTRIGLELIIVIFRIGEDVRSIRDRGILTISGSTLPASQPSSAAVAGWYEDPHKVARVRYWDGAAWTDQTQE